MDYRDCLPRFPLLPGQPDRLLAELLEAQTVLAIFAYYVSCRHAYPFTGSTLPSRHYSCAADETLHEARDIVDRVIEGLRIQVAETPLNADEKSQTSNYLLMYPTIYGLLCLSTAATGRGGVTGTTTAAAKNRT